MHPFHPPFSPRGPQNHPFCAHLRAPFFGPFACSQAWMYPRLADDFGFGFCPWRPVLKGGFCTGQD